MLGRGGGLRGGGGGLVTSIYIILLLFCPTVFQYCSWNEAIINIAPIDLIEEGATKGERKGWGDKHINRKKGPGPRFLTTVSHAVVSSVSSLVDQEKY